MNKHTELKVKNALMYLIRTRIMNIHTYSKLSGHYILWY